MLELVSAARWKIPAWSEILFALASLLPEREAWSPTSVTALPRSKCGEGAARRLRGREGAVGLGVGKASGSRIACCARTAGQWQDKCHPLPVRRDGSLAAKET